MASLHPEFGARIVLTRERADADGARYAVEIYEPAQFHAGAAEVSADGAVRFDPWRGDPPAWAVTFAERNLALLARKAEWPRKLTRWRSEAGT